MELNRLPKQIFQGRLPEGKRGWGRLPTSIQKGYMDDITFTSTTGGGHFHVTREGQKFWDSAQDRVVWKGLINVTWATKASKPWLVGVAGCGSELLLDGHPNVID